MRILILNGPNLSRLGTREPSVYGQESYADLVSACESEAAVLGVAVDVRQSDSESELLSWLESASSNYEGVILNAGALTHYSYPLGEACSALTVPCIEVHLSNPHSRETFRAKSVLSKYCLGVICGFGFDSYRLAMRGLVANRDNR